MEITKWSRYANTDHSLCRKPRPGNSSLARANVTAHRRQEPMSREFNDWVDQTNHARPKARDKLAGYLHDGMTPANSMSTCGRTEKQQQLVNLRNIPVEPNHDGWCGCLQDQLCKQIFVTVRRRCDGGAWQVWELLLVANASNTIADYHLLHQW